MNPWGGNFILRVARVALHNTSRRNRNFKCHHNFYLPVVTSILRLRRQKGEKERENDGRLHQEREMQELVA